MLKENLRKIDDSISSDNKKENKIHRKEERHWYSDRLTTESKWEQSLVIRPQQLNQSWKKRGHR